MKINFVIIIFSFAFSQLGISQTDNIQNFINNEIYTIDLCYSNNFFIEDIKLGTNHVEQIEHTLLYSGLIKGTTIDFIKTNCLLDRNLFQQKYFPDTLVFYSIKIDNKTYRMFGFLFTDFLQMCHEKGISSDLFINFLSASNYFEKRELRQLKSSINHGNVFSEKIGYPIQYFVKYSSKEPILNTIIIPVNFNQFIIYD